MKCMMSIRAPKYLTVFLLPSPCSSVDIILNEAKWLNQTSSNNMLLTWLTDRSRPTPTGIPFTVGSCTDKSVAENVNTVSYTRGSCQTEKHSANKRQHCGSATHNYQPFSLSSCLRRPHRLSCWLPLIDGRRVTGVQVTDAPTDTSCRTQLRRGRF